MSSAQARNLRQNQPIAVSRRVHRRVGTCPGTADELYSGDVTGLRTSSPQAGCDDGAQPCGGANGPPGRLRVHTVRPRPPDVRV